MDEHTPVTVTEISRRGTLFLDAGNTLVFLDMSAVSQCLSAHAVELSPATLQAAEGSAKRHYEKALQQGASHENGWFLYMQTLLECSGITTSAARSLVPHLRTSHDRLNLWRKLAPGLKGQLSQLKGQGVQLGIISNSEGRLDHLFNHLGIAHLFSVIVDSAIEKVRKPDPEIFRRAIERMGVHPSDCMYVGDIPDVDVIPALAMGMQSALIDPFDFFPDFRRAPRFRSLSALLKQVYDVDASIDSEKER